jgi:site-specific recombinase XerD
VVERAARTDLRRTAVAFGVRRHFAPDHLRHAHAVELALEGVPLIVIQRRLERLAIAGGPPRRAALGDARHEAQ